MNTNTDNNLVVIPADNGRESVGTKKTVKFTIDIEQIISEREIKITIKNYPMIMNSELISKFGQTLNACLQYFYKAVKGGK